MANFITRKYQRVTYPRTVQENSNYQIFDEIGPQLDRLFIADDSEWETPVTNTAQRPQTNIISHQYTCKLNGYPVVSYVIFRDPSEKPFSFWDISCVIKQYLSDVGYKRPHDQHEVKRIAKLLKMNVADVQQYLGQYRIPPVVMVGYFQGVDVSAYADWYKYLDSTDVSTSADKKVSKANVIALYKNVFFTDQFAMLINSPDRKRKTPLLVQYRDTMSLGPQGYFGLAKLGEIVKQPKLDTTEWDKEDHNKGLISDHDYNHYLNQGGYYKTHMRILLNNRRDDYVRYALGDAEITLKYLGFFMQRVFEICCDGLIDHLYIPATLTSLCDAISDHYAQQPFDDQQIAALVNQVFGSLKKLDKYLRPVNFNQQPPKFVAEWNDVISLITNVFPQSPSEIKKANSDERIAMQKLFINKLSSYFARGSVIWTISVRNNRMYKFIPDNILEKINFAALYKNNPNLDPRDLISGKQLGVKQYVPNISTSMIENAQFNANAYHFKRNSKNELPSLDDVLEYLWGRSVYLTYHEGREVVRADVYYWLTKWIDFRFTRRGYHFKEPDKKVAKHAANAHDLTSVVSDQAYNPGFEMMRRAYMGGMNLCYAPGIIKFPWTYDVDLVSSYGNAGHLIPDISLDQRPWIDRLDMTQEEFSSRIIPNLPNGPFTVGVCDVDYQLPNDIKRVPVGVKGEIKGDSPHYVLQHSRACLTLTDVLNLYNHGAQLYIHRVIIPVQKTLNGTFANLCPAGKEQDWALAKRMAAKKQFGNESAEQQFYKLLVNGQYGKTGQGLNERVSRDYGDYKTYFIPFAKSSNPFYASQYTAICRFQVNFLMDAMEKIYQGSLIPSVTTDGFIFCSPTKVDPDQINQYIRKYAPAQWIQVNDTWFNGKFYEFKSKIPNDKDKCSRNTTLVNLRTRFNFTLDGKIRAATGVLGLSIEDLYNELTNNEVMLKVESHRLSSLVDMKHRVDYKYLLNEWTQPVWLSLSYDDSYHVNGFHDNGDGFGYYVTKPFRTIDEAKTFKDEMKPYHNLFPLFNSNYAKAFISFDNSIVNVNGTKHVSWVLDDVSTSLKAKNYDELKDKYENEYVLRVSLRYLKKYCYQNTKVLKQIYQSSFTDNYTSYRTFKAAVNHSTDSSSFVNELVVLEQGWSQPRSDKEAA